MGWIEPPHSCVNLGIDSAWTHSFSRYNMEILIVPISLGSCRESNRPYEYALISLWHTVRHLKRTVADCALFFV